MKLKIAAVTVFALVLTTSAFAQRRPGPRPRPGQGACRIMQIERTAQDLAYSARQLAQDARYDQVRRVVPARELAQASRQLTRSGSGYGRPCAQARRAFPQIARAFHQLRQVFETGRPIGYGPSVRPGHHRPQHPGHGRPGLRRLRRQFEQVAQSFRRLRRVVMSQGRPGHGGGHHGGGNGGWDNFDVY